MRFVFLNFPGGPSGPPPTNWTHKVMDLGLRGLQEQSRQTEERRGTVQVGGEEGDSTGGWGGGGQYRWVGRRGTVQVGGEEAMCGCGCKTHNS